MPRLIKRLPVAAGLRERVLATRLEPRFGENYKTGYIGFAGPAPVGGPAGLVFLTGWSRLSDVAVDRVLVVVGEGVCVTCAAGRGVVRLPLDGFFAGPRARLVFRKPRKLDAALGARVAAAAAGHAGERLDHLAAAARLLEASFLGRWLGGVFRDLPGRLVPRIERDDERWLSAELAAAALDAQPEYAGRGVLAAPRHAVDPQELFEDDELFAAWKDEPPDGKPKPSQRTAAGRAGPPPAAPIA